MPPVQVFVGLDAVRASAEEVPGLPTREELKQWLVEHDKIEKETEIFDSGELKKLKKFTKGVSLVQLTRMLSLMVCIRDVKRRHSVTCLLRTQTS
jgi:hypothetical protein